MIDSIVKIVRGIVKLRGDTDNTIIGNIGNSLKVVTIDEINKQIILGNGFSSTTSDGQLTINTTEGTGSWIKNNGSKTMYIYDIFLGSDPSNASSWLEYRIYYNPTITANGTAMTINNLLAGSSTTSSANSYYLPTTSSFGKLINIIIDGVGNAAGLIKNWKIPSYYVLPPNQSLLITAIAKSNSTTYYCSYHWIEV